MTLTLSSNSRTILEKRYLQENETPEQLFRRVANFVSSTEAEKEWGDKFYQLLSSLKFLPNSPTLVNAGTNKGCLSACFTCSPDDTMESILQTVYNWGLIEKWGGGVGIGLGNIRPKGDKISTTHGQALGPIAVMEMLSFNASKITQGAFRMGAHMSQIPITHPNCLEFIHCKDGNDTLQNFNISVQVSDAFMQAVQDDTVWLLINPKDKQITKTLLARELWDELCSSAWKTGDPGIVFMDRVHETAPNPTLGPILTSNPCSEEFLENMSNCCLGSIDLSKHLTIAKDDFDYTALQETVQTAVRFLDDVIEVNVFPLPQLREMNLKTRRIGLGVMGLADALAFLKIPYDSQEALEISEEVARVILNTAWQASRELAKERGEYPLFSVSIHKDKEPVRHSSVITIAPTGSISRIAGCSSGIEPYFGRVWKSNILWDANGATTEVYDCPLPIREELEHQYPEEEIQLMLRKAFADQKYQDFLINKDLYRTAMDISPEAHVKMQAVWQKYTTNAVSKTINLRNNATVQDVKDAYMLAWKTGCKSITVYRDGSKDVQVLETSNSSKNLAPVSTNHTRPEIVSGETIKMRSGHGNTYITVNRNGDGKPFELFTHQGKAGGCDAAQLEALSRIISLAFRSGVEVEEVIEQLQGITCCPIWYDGKQILSAPDAIAQALQKTNGAPLRHDPSVIKYQTCRICGGSNIIYQEGCLTCGNCGSSKCD